jgi:2-C-methyl-D-erythritol 2,4-cyclodiphosphate synthase
MPASPQPPPFRTGIGYDLHRTAPQRPLILSGLRIPAEFGLLGHSDADVVLHAVSDALLGASGNGDIGEHFPDTDPEWKDADSAHFVEAARHLVTDAGWTIVNVDVVIHAEKPKLKPYKPAMVHRLAELLDIPAERVGLKATTNEGLDAVGRGEAIACWASVLIGQTPSESR